MSTQKRQRQRENRLLRLAAVEAQAKRRARNQRIMRIGIAAGLVVVVLASIWLVRRLSDDNEIVTTGSPIAADDTPAFDDEDMRLEDSPDGPDGDETGLPDDSQAPDAAETPDTSAPTPDDSAGIDDGGSPDLVVGEPAPPGCPATDGSSGRVINFDEPHPMCINLESHYTAVFDTSEGAIRFRLHDDQVPGTVNNFVTLARWGYYDDTLIFRTDPSIDIIQGGAPHTNSPSDPGPGYTIPDEPEFEVDSATGQMTGPYRYVPGQLVMARTGAPDSASAQYFITTGNNASFLDNQGTYVVFGDTDDAGLAVAQSIIGLHVEGESLGGAPSRDVTVRSVTIEETRSDG